MKPVEKVGKSYVFGKKHMEYLRANINKKSYKALGEKLGIPKEAVMAKAKRHTWGKRRKATVQKYWYTNENKAIKLICNFIRDRRYELEEKVLKLEKELGVEHVEYTEIHLVRRKDGFFNKKLQKYDSEGNE